MALEARDRSLEETTEREREKYASVYRSWPGYGSANHGLRWFNFAEAPGRMILDIGAGDGAFCQLCRDAGATGAVGVDLCPDSPLVVAAPAHAIPFQDAGFDIITAWDVLEHLPPELVGPSLREMRRLIRPNGRFWASIADFPHVYEGQTLHLSLLGPDGWATAFRDAGFSVEHVRDKLWIADPA